MLDSNMVFALIHNLNVGLVPCFEIPVECTVICLDIKKNPDIRAALKKGGSMTTHFNGGM